MALGDGSSWDETLPTDATQGIQIDDYLRDVRVGVRGRMAQEHEWPASQSATSQGGMHKFVTLQAQAVKPTLSGTQIGAVYVKTDNCLYYQNSAGIEIQITLGTALNIDTSQVVLLTGSQSITGTKTFASMIASTGVIGGITMVGTLMTGALLGVSGSGSSGGLSNGAFYTVPAGYYVNGVKRGASGEIDQVTYARL